MLDYTGIFGIFVPFNKIEPCVAQTTNNHQTPKVVDIAPLKTATKNQ